MIAEIHLFSDNVTTNTHTSTQRTHIVSFSGVFPGWAGSVLKKRPFE